MEALQRAFKLKQELDSLRPLSKEDEQRVMQKFRLDWNYHSNNLEGNSLSYGETKALILFGITAQGKPLKDHFEIVGHDEAIKWILEILKEDRPLTESFIRELHRLILKEPYDVDAITPEGHPTKKKIKVGAYKTTPNHVETVTGELFYFATPEETPALMNELLSWYQEKSKDSTVNPIVLGIEFHYRFIRIHPFDDGNGRIARILMNFILMRFGYPPAIIKTEDKGNYFAALRQADAGLLEPFVDYISQNLIHSLEIMIRGAKGDSIEEEGDLEKEIALLKERLKTIEDPLKAKKSEESMLSLFDGSIIPLLKVFLEKGSKFNNLYLESKIFVKLNGFFTAIDLNQGFSILRNSFGTGVQKLEVQLFYRGFKQKKLGDFEFTSSIHLEFILTKFKVDVSASSFSLVKYYGDLLTPIEINQIVNAEIRRHKDFIEQKIEEGKG